MPAKHHVYVHAEDYQEERHGPTRPPTRNRAYEILAKHYNELPHQAQYEFDALRSKAAKQELEIALWARRFRTAYLNGDPLPPRKFGRTVDVDTSREKETKDLRSMARALWVVLETGERGVTSMEARTRGERGGGVSGSLNLLHRAGVVVCLTRTR